MSFPPIQPQAGLNSIPNSHSIEEHSYVRSYIDIAWFVFFLSKTSFEIIATIHLMLQEKRKKEPELVKTYRVAIGELVQTCNVYQSPSKIYANWSDSTEEKILFSPGLEELREGSRHPLTRLSSRPFAKVLGSWQLYQTKISLLSTWDNLYWDIYFEKEDFHLQTKTSPSILQGDKNVLEIYQNPSEWFQKIASVTRSALGEMITVTKIQAFYPPKASTLSARPFLEFPCEEITKSRRRNIRATPTEEDNLNAGAPFRTRKIKKDGETIREFWKDHEIKIWIAPKGGEQKSWFDSTALCTRTEWNVFMRVVDRKKGKTLPHAFVVVEGIRDRRHFVEQWHLHAEQGVKELPFDSTKIEKGIVKRTELFRCPSWKAEKMLSHIKGEEGNKFFSLYRGITFVNILLRFIPFVKRKYTCLTWVKKSLELIDIEITPSLSGMLLSVATDSPDRYVEKHPFNQRS